MWFFLVRPTMSETTSLGAAIAAGSAKGIEVWNIDNIEEVPNDTFLPSIAEDGKTDIYFIGNECLQLRKIMF